MGSSKFDDRVQYKTYEKDAEVHFGLAEARKDPSDWIGLPERLVVRLTTLGEAYELHHIPMMDIYGDTVLRSKQCENLSEELGFLLGVIQDAALQQVVARLAGLLKQTRGTSLCLMVSGN